MARVPSKAAHRSGWPSLVPPPTELNLDRGRPRGRPLHLRAACPIERILRTEHLAIRVSTRPAALPSLGKHRLTPLNGISWKALSSPSGNAFSSFEVCSLPHCRIAGRRPLHQRPQNAGTGHTLIPRVRAAKRSSARVARTCRKTVLAETRQQVSTFANGRAGRHRPHSVRQRMKIRLQNDSGLIAWRIPGRDTERPASKLWEF